MSHAIQMIRSAATLEAYSAHLRRDDIKTEKIQLKQPDGKIAQPIEVEELHRQHLVPYEAWLVTEPAKLLPNLECLTPYYRTPDLFASFSATSSVTSIVNSGMTAVEAWNLWRRALERLQTSACAILRQVATNRNIGPH